MFNLKPAAHFNLRISYVRNTMIAEFTMARLQVSNICGKHKVYLDSRISALFAPHAPRCRCTWLLYLLCLEVGGVSQVSIECKATCEMDRNQSGRSPSHP
jgi:hypothetical protein